MMPVIRISDAALVDLKSIATWEGTKTPSLTVEALVKEKMEALGLERDIADTTGDNLPDEDLEFEDAPGLSFTRVVSASVNKTELRRANWARVLLSVISAVKDTGFDGPGLSKELQVPSRVGRFEDHGFTFHDDLGISVQGQSAGDAWREAQRLANKYSIPVTVRFQWRENPKAQHPGRTGVLRAG